MTATAIASAYLTGVVWLMWLDFADRIYLEPMVRAAWTVFARRRRYTGHHRGVGRVTRAGRAELAAVTEVSRIRRHTFAALMAERRLREVLLEPTGEMLLPDFPGECGYGPGAKSYGALRTRLLDAQVSVDLIAQRLRSSVPA